MTNNAIDQLPPPGPASLFGGGLAVELAPCARRAQGALRALAGQDLDPSGKRTPRSVFRGDHRAVGTTRAARPGRSVGVLRRAVAGLRKVTLATGWPSSCGSVPRTTALELQLHYDNWPRG